MNSETALAIAICEAYCKNDCSESAAKALMDRLETDQAFRWMFGESAGVEEHDSKDVMYINSNKFNIQLTISANDVKQILDGRYRQSLEETAIHMFAPFKNSDYASPFEAVSLLSEMYPMFLAYTVINAFDRNNSDLIDYYRTIDNNIYHQVQISVKAIPPTSSATH